MKEIIRLRESVVLELTPAEQESQDFSHLVVSTEVFESFEVSLSSIDSLLDIDLDCLCDDHINTADSLEEACEIALEMSYGV